MSDTNRIMATIFAALVLLGGVAVFQLKEQARHLEQRLDDMNAQVAADEAAVRVLEAEWTYLSRPERLEELNGRYMGLRPVEADQVVSSLDEVDQLIPAKEEEGVVAPSKDKAVSLVSASAPKKRPTVLPRAPQKAGVQLVSGQGGAR